MSNSIILFYCLFGSIYLTSKSLEFINKSFLENKKIPRKLIIINNLTFIISGSIFICCFTLSNLQYFKSLK